MNPSGIRLGSPAVTTRGFREAEMREVGALIAEVLTHIADEQVKNRAARAYTTKFFTDAGYKVAASDANFLMVDVHRDAKAFKMECIKHKVAIGRAFPSLPTYARISIGTMPEMKKAVAVFHAVLASPVAASQQ
jgi:histidinol-phosphate/aromatic aminotransferase/cobyric acid decarboxylase-like protein